jgi:hypothetical protein
MEPKPKRKYTRRVPTGVATVPLMPLDPLVQAQEVARHAQEGNLKLAKAVEALRAGLETIVVAEMDNRTGLPVGISDLKQIAVAALDAYSAQCGQSWRSPKNRLISSWAGDRNITTANAYAGGE